MRALRVVLDPPVLDQHLRLEQAVELLDRQELVAQPTIERLDVRVLPRRTGLDVAAARTAEPAPVAQRVGREFGISYRTALRRREIGEAPQDVVDSYIAPAFEAPERDTAGEGPLDADGDPEPLLSTSQLLRLLHAARGSGSQDHDTDADARLLSLDLPDALIAVIERVLGSVDRYAGEQGMRDPHWRGRVLVTPPPGSAVPFSLHLLQLYESGAVSDAILVVQTAQHSPAWRPFARWPHCLLAAAALEGLPAAPLTVFCVSEEPEVRERFRDGFVRFGYVYPDGAVSEIVPRERAAA